MQALEQKHKKENENSRKQVSILSSNNMQRESVFCSIMYGGGGCGWQLVKQTSKGPVCAKCGKRIPTRTRLEQALERLDKIMEINERAFKHSDPMATIEEVAKSGLKFPFPMGKNILMVDLNDLIALNKIKPDDYVQKMIFLESLERTCPSIKMKL